MADSPIPEQGEVRRKGRQRLIGAIVLVLLAVVFLPMVFDPEPRQAGRDAGRFSDRSLAIPAKEGAPALPTPTPGPASKPAEAPKEAAKPPSKAPPVAAKTLAVGPKLEGFAVQVGAFRDEAKLAQAREKLAAAKIAHFIERLPLEDLTRLRAGPYATREAAEKARAEVVAAGLEGRVVSLP